VGAFILSFLFQKVFRSAFFRFNKSFFLSFLSFFGISKFESLFFVCIRTKAGSVAEWYKGFLSTTAIKITTD